MSTAEQAGAAAVARLTERIAAAAGALDGVEAEAIAGGVRLTGPRLALRWMTDARLRWLALTAARDGR